MAWLAIAIIIVGAGCGGRSTSHNPDSGFVVSPNMELSGYASWHDPSNYLPCTEECCLVSWTSGEMYTSIDGFVPSFPEGRDFRVVFTFDFDQINCDNLRAVFRSEVQDRTPEELTYISVNIRTVGHEEYEALDLDLQVSCSEANVGLNWGDLSLDDVLPVEDGLIEADLTELFSDRQNGRFQFGIAVLESNETSMGEYFFFEESTLEVSCN